jgi:hypothetical protein
MNISKIQVIFWVLIHCSEVVRYQLFRRPCCLHLQSGFGLQSRQ